VLTPVLSRHWDDPRLHTIDGYESHDGYAAARTALGMDPDSLNQLVKD
jgi:NADH-quinone oxidoreductase subunit F